MSAADRFTIVIGFMSVMVAIMTGMLSFLWKLSATLSALTVRIGALEKAQDSALTISPPRRRTKRT